MYKAWLFIGPIGPARAQQKNALLIILLFIVAEKGTFQLIEQQQTTTKNGQKKIEKKNTKKSAVQAPNAGIARCLCPPSCGASARFMQRCRRSTTNRPITAVLSLSPQRNGHQKIYEPFYRVLFILYSVCVGEMTQLTSLYLDRMTTVGREIPRLFVFPRNGVCVLGLA